MGLLAEVPGRRLHIPVLSMGESCGLFAFVNRPAPGYPPALSVIRCIPGKMQSQ